MSKCQAQMCARRESLYSLWSTGSVLSIGSHNSVLSIASVNSFGAIGSVGSAGSVFSWFSAGSAASAFSAGSIASTFAAGARGTLSGCPAKVSLPVAFGVIGGTALTAALLVSRLAASRSGQAAALPAG